MTLDELLAEGRRAWPMLSADPPVTDILRRKDAAPDGDLGTFDAAEVFLAAALLGGDAAAPGAFEQRYFSVIDAVLDRAGATRDELDEVRQVLRKRLLVPPGDGPPRLVDYCGEGRLAGLLRIAATRALVNLRTKRRPGGGLDQLAEHVAAELDPQRAILKQQERTDVADAIRAAARGLSQRARTLLRLNLVDGLSVDELGRVFQLHRSNAARQLARARDELIAGTRARLAERWGSDAAALELISSSLDVTLGRVLATGSTWGGGKPPPA